MKPGGVISVLAVVAILIGIWRISDSPWPLVIAFGYLMAYIGGIAANRRR